MKRRQVMYVQSMMHTSISNGETTGEAKYVKNTEIERK